MDSSPNIFKGVTLMFASATLIPITDAIAKSMSAEYSVLQVVWMRFVIIALILGPIVIQLTMRERISLKPDRPLLEFIRALMMLLNNLFYFKAIQVMPLVDALGIFFLYPIITLLLSVKFLNEQFGAWQLTICLLGFLGILFIIKPGVSYTEGSLYALLSSVCISINIVLSRHLSSYSSPLLSLFYTSMLGAFAMSFTVISVWKTPDTLDFAAFACMALVAALCNWLLYAAFKYAPASFLSPIGYFEIVSATIIGYLIFGNIPSYMTAFGVTIVCLSGFALLIKKNRAVTA